MRMPYKRNLVLYILDQDKKPVIANHDEWASFMTDPEKRILFRTEIKDVAVSTAFLGLDHRFIGLGPPLLFETMIFKNGIGIDMKRYSSYDDAETGHTVAVRRIKRELKVV
jgi:hypothetical protein